MVDPISTPASFVGQARAIATSQRGPSVEGVGDAARIIRAEVVQAKGDTVGVLRTPARADEGGLAGAGLYTGGFKA